MKRSNQAILVTYTEIKGFVPITNHIYYLRELGLHTSTRPLPDKVRQERIQTRLQPIFQQSKAKQRNRRRNQQHWQKGKTHKQHKPVSEGLSSRYGQILNQRSDDLRNRQALYLVFRTQDQPVL